MHTIKCSVCSLFTWASSEQYLPVSTLYCEWCALCIVFPNANAHRSSERQSVMFWCAHKVSEIDRHTVLGFTTPHHTTCPDIAQKQIAACRCWQLRDRFIGASAHTTQQSTARFHLLPNEHHLIIAYKVYNEIESNLCVCFYCFIASATSRICIYLVWYPIFDNQPGDIHNDNSHIHTITRARGPVSSYHMRQVQTETTNALQNGYLVLVTGPFVWHVSYPSVFGGLRSLCQPNNQQRMCNTFKTAMMAWHIYIGNIAQRPINWLIYCMGLLISGLSIGW